MDRADDIISHIDKTGVEVEEDLMKEEQDSDEDLMEEFDRGQYNGVIGVSCNATAEAA